MSGGLWSSLLAALLVAFSRLFWSLAVVAEVYTLNALLIGGVVLAAIFWRINRGSKPLLGLAFMYGLSLAHHPSALLLGPGLAGLVAAGSRGRRLGWPAGLGALLVGGAPLLLYLYLPLRFLADPPLNYVGDYFDVNLASPGGLAWMVSGRMFAGALFGRPLATALAELLALAGQLWLNLFGAGLLLALYGLRLLRPRSLAVFLGGSAAIVLLFFAFYNVVDTVQMVLPALILLAPPLALGLKQFGQDLSRLLALPETSRSLLKIGLTASVVGVVVAANWRFADRQNDWQAYDFARDVLAQVAPDALILAQWTSATPLEYLQIVEGSRPDVLIFDRGIFALGARDRLLRAQGADRRSVGLAVTGELVAYVNTEIERRPVYTIEAVPSLAHAFCLVPQENDIYQIVMLPAAATACHSAPVP